MLVLGSCAVRQVRAARAGGGSGLFSILDETKDVWPDYFSGQREQTRRSPATPWLRHGNMQSS